MFSLSGNRMNENGKNRLVDFLPEIQAGCPDRDLIRLWPLPVQSLWFEDWREPVEGVIL